MTMTALLIAAMAVAPPAPPPPVLPPPTARAIVSPQAMPERFASFDVDVRAGSEQLWTGPMRLSNRIAARFNRTKSDAQESGCPNDVTGGVMRMGASTSLTVDLSQRYGGDRAADSFQLVLSWGRPGDNAGCPARQSSRTVSLNESFELKQGAQIVINGDGGVVVRIRRRD